MNLRYQNVLFDLDGTLTDPAPGITRSVQYALEKLGRVDIPSESDLLWTIGPPLRENLAVLLGNNDPALIEQGAAYYRERYSEVGLFENEVYPQIAEHLALIRETGCRLFVATSKPLPYALRILDHFKLHSFFEQVYGSEYDGTHSDKVQLIAHLVAVEEINASQSLMVGDRMHDIRAARQNGMAAAGVTYGYGTQEELIAAEPDYMIHSLAELPALMQENN